MTTSTVRPVELLLGTDHTLEITALTNSLLAELVADATVEATVLDAADEEVLGETWPLTLVPDALVDGRYLATLSAALELVEDQRVTIVVVADAGAGLQRTWYVPAVVRRGR